MKLFERISKRLVGSRLGPSEEEVELERRHREAVASLRQATAHINGRRLSTLGEIEEKIDVADGMMREALESGGD